jgi:Mg-chelatase subunit ChlD
MSDPDIPVSIAYGTQFYSASPTGPSNLRPAQRLTSPNARVAPLLLHPEKQQPVDEGNMRELEEHGFTKGLVEAMLRDKEAFALRIFLVDNSGSMSTNDGHSIVETGRQHEIKFLPCSRWKEMQETIDYQASVAALLKNPTEFRMLNDPGRSHGPQKFSIGEQSDTLIDAELDVARSTLMSCDPHGVTPLVQHLKDIRCDIEALEPTLRRNRTKVLLVICTDELPSDNQGISTRSIQQEFVAALRSLAGLPVWLVVRLFTDEKAIVQYYNNLDSQLELNLEVLDDLAGEAKGVHTHNKWLNYALPLHRMREMGFSHRIFDILDERKLSKDELWEFFLILFGNSKLDGVPDPDVDWKGFLASIALLVENEKPQANPFTRKLEPWVNMKQLRKYYGGGNPFFG